MVEVMGGRMIFGDVGVVFYFIGCVCEIFE